MEIHQLYVEESHKEDDLHLPVRNSLAHTVNAMLLKLKLCDLCTVPAGSDYGPIFERNFLVIHIHLNLVPGGFFLFQFF